MSDFTHGVDIDGAVSNITAHILSFQGSNSIYVIIAVLFDLCNYCRPFRSLFALSRLALLAFRCIFSVFKIIFKGIKFCFRLIFMITTQALYIIFDTIDYAMELPFSLIFKLTRLVKKNDH
jgi:hypothetical protein